MSRIYFCLFIFCLLFYGALAAENKPNQGAEKDALERQAKNHEQFQNFRAGVAKKLKAEYEAAQKKYKDDKNILVLPAIIANKKQRWVKAQGIFAATTAGDPIEVFMCGPGGSEHETAIIIYSRAEYIRQAMDFIGVKPGMNISYSQDRYRPLGERVSISLTFKSKKQEKMLTIPFEELLRDKAKPMSKDGFVYTGSSWVTGADKTQRLKADLSRFVVSAYNSSSTLFDNPRLVGTLDNNNDTLYNLNPKYTPLTRERIAITIKPLLPAGKSRVMIFDTKATVDAGGVIRLTTHVENGNLRWKNQTLDGFIAAYKKLDLKNKDRHLKLKIDDKFPVKYLAELSKKISTLEWLNILREKEDPFVQSFYHPGFNLKRRATAWMSVLESGRVPKRVRLYKKDGKILADSFGETEYTAADLKELLNHDDYKFRGVANVFVALYDEFTYGDLKPFFKAVPKQPHHYVHFIRRIPRIILDPDLPISVDGEKFFTPFTALSPEGIKRYKLMMVLPQDLQGDDGPKELELFAWQTVPKTAKKGGAEKTAPKKVKLSPEVKLGKAGKYHIVIHIEDEKGNREKSSFSVVREKD